MCNRLGQLGCNRSHPFGVYGHQVRNHRRQPEQVGNGVLMLIPAADDASKLLAASISPDQRYLALSTI